MTRDSYYVCMWSGRIMMGERMNVEDLDIQYLMKLAQEAIISREGIIIDEAINNKLIK